MFSKEQAYACEVWNINESGADSGRIYENEEWYDQYCSSMYASERIAKQMSRNLLDKAAKAAAAVNGDGLTEIGIKDSNIIPSPEEYQGRMVLQKLRDKTAIEKVPFFDSISFNIFFQKLTFVLSFRSKSSTRNSTDWKTWSLSSVVGCLQAS